MKHGACICLLISLFWALPATAADPATQPAYPVVKRYQAGSDSFRVNSYLIETAKSVILIDTQFTNNDFKSLSEAINRAGKPLAAIIISHPHPDHYNNLAALIRKYPSIPVYATAETTAAIKRDDQKHRTLWSGVYRSFYPTDLAFPTHTLRKGETRTFDGVTLAFDTLESGESVNQLLIHFPAINTLFVGDLVYNGVHSYTREGKLKSWIDNLRQVKQKYPTISTLYPGHGESGSLELLALQEDYLNTLRDAVRSKIDQGNEDEPLPGTASAEVSQILQKKFPFIASYMISMGIDAIAREELYTFGKKDTNPFMY